MPPLPPSLADRFARIIDALCREVAALGSRRLLAAPLVILLWTRLRRSLARFTVLTTRPRAANPRSAPSPRPIQARPTAMAAPPPPRLPRHFAWLSQLAPATRAHASQLQHLLAEPEMTALLAASPAMQRLLRPLCRMLGLTLPPAPPQAAAAPLPVTAATPHAAPDAVPLRPPRLAPA